MAWDGMAVIALPLPPSLCEDGEPSPVSSRLHCHPFGNMLTTSSVRPSLRPKGQRQARKGRGRAVHFHGRLNKSSDGVCWFLDRSGCGEGEAGTREAACKAGRRKLAMQRRRSGAAAAAVMVLHNRQGMGCSCRGPLRPRMGPRQV